jgi:hypothetical protein
MPRSTYGLSSALDPDALLRMMYDDRPFMPSSTSGGSDYVRGQFAVDPPPIALVGASRRPGLDTATAAMNAPPSLASSLAAMGLGLPTSGLAQSQPSQMHPQAALFRWLGLPSSWLPSPPEAAGAIVPIVDGQQIADNPRSRYCRARCSKLVLMAPGGRQPFTWDQCIAHCEGKTYLKQVHPVISYPSSDN